MVTLGSKEATTSLAPSAPRSASSPIEVGRTAGEWQGDEGLTMVRQLVGYLGESPIVFGGSMQAELLLAAAREAAHPT